MKCWMVKTWPDVTVDVCYIAVTNSVSIEGYAQRFVQTYLDHPAGYNHKLTIICNGGRLNPRRREYFKRVQCDFFERENDAGFDISAYQDFAARSRANFMVCFGESVHFHRAGWLDRIVSARMEYGPGMYGCFSSHMVRAHLNTTGFGVDPRFLVKYPRVVNNPQRYEFEHGQNCFWKRLVAGDHIAAFVTFDGVWFQGEWRYPDNILHRGDQSNLLAWANHSERYTQANQATRELWTKQSDSKFRL